ncbi:helix-turn-helix domain-containing protein [Roseivivax sediminis]|nr:helix-turn-helix domain-containing protein [Roseivivax sediminis]
MTSPQDGFETEGGSPRGFDDFALRLGDVMRGERATLAKSLLDVQRELRIKASYIAAIENCDPSAFDTPGFIAGYVRSYARYLGMDPDETFHAFCQESGFSVAHGMSAEASVLKRPREAPEAKAAQPARDPFKQPALPFAPANDSLLSRIEPGAVGSMLVLTALIGGIGYGGYTVLQEVQRVQVTPVDQTPVVLSDLDPVAAARPAAPEDEAEAVESAGVFSPPSNEALDRLYRPQALDVPVLVARDAPISTLDPSRVGAFAGAGRNELPNVQTANSATSAIEQTLAEVLGGDGSRTPVTGPRDGVTTIAVRPAWVRVSDASGAKVFEGILNAGDTYAPGPDVEGPVLQVGESGAVYFAVAGETYGPVGARGSVTSGVALEPEAVTQRFAEAAPSSDADLQRVVAELNLDRAPRVASAEPSEQTVPAPTPQVLEEGNPRVTIVATAETWVRVRDATGADLFESVMQAGDTYDVPQTSEPPTIRSGNAGAVYFAVNGETYGPYGSTGAIADNLALTVAEVTQTMRPADPAQNAVLGQAVAELSGAAAPVAEE